MNAGNSVRVHVWWEPSPLILSVSPESEPPLSWWQQIVEYLRVLYR